ncbi:MAG: hypothetical protein IPL28_17455 [Chloroflexi bacterium]|nr:hypothetical protein [Chloroflexota bacterium]
MAETPPPKSQAQLLFELQQRKARRFNLWVNVSWLILLGTLFFLFSGIDWRIGGLHITTIQLDFGFMRQQFPFILGGVGLTILLAALSISLAMVLALLGALGRLSRFPPAYALATFYISLIREPSCSKSSFLSRPAPTGHSADRFGGWCPRFGAELQPT